MRTAILSRSFVLYLAFLAVSAVLYSASFDNSFRGDDFGFIQHVVKTSGTSELLQPSPNFAFYRPGSVGLFSLEMRLFGIQDGGRYLVLNFVLHVVNSLFLIFLLLDLSVPREASFLAGGLFVLGFGHYGKQVMWACTSGALLSVSLVLGTVILAARCTKANTRWCVPAMAVPMVLAPAFHEIGLAAPVLALVVWILGAGRTRRRWGLLAMPLLIVVAWLSLYAWLSGSHQPYGRAVHAIAGLPGMIVRYLGLMVLPIQHSALVENRSGLFDLALKASYPLHILLGLAAVAWTLYLVKKGGASRFVAIWLYVALIPFCLVKMPEGWLDLRYVYFAAMPLCALVASAAAKLFAGRGRAMRAAVTVVILLAAVMSAYVVHTLEAQYDAQSRNAPPLSFQSSETLDNLPMLGKLL